MTDSDVPIAPVQPNTFQTYGPDEGEEVDEDHYGTFGTHNGYYQPNYPEHHPVESSEPYVVDETMEELRSPGMQRMTRAVGDQKNEEKPERRTAHF